MLAHSLAFTGRCHPAGHGVRLVGVPEVARGRRTSFSDLLELIGFLVPWWMPMRSSKDARRMPDEIDENQAAFRVVQQATDGEATGPQQLARIIRDIHDALEVGDDPDDLAERIWPRLQAVVLAHSDVVSLDEAAAELGRKGGLSGGKARAEKLTPDERSEIARLAAMARWKKAGKRETED
jgi:hypothetical protein